MSVAENVLVPQKSIYVVSQLSSLLSVLPMTIPIGIQYQHKRLSPPMTVQVGPSGARLVTCLPYAQSQMQATRFLPAHSHPMIELHNMLLQ